MRQATQSYVAELLLAWASAKEAKAFARRVVVPPSNSVYLLPRPQSIYRRVDRNRPKQIRVHHLWQTPPPRHPKANQPGHLLSSNRFQMEYVQVLQVSFFLLAFTPVVF